jgi:hypothetical protein
MVDIVMAYNSVRLTFGFSRSRKSQDGSTHHDATTGGSRTMDAQPRMPPGHNPPKSKAAGCKPVLCPAAMT